MIKKSQFALVFLTVAAMLAVWFIKDPLAASTNKPNEQITETSRLRGIKDLRESLTEADINTIKLLYKIKPQITNIEDNRSEFIPYFVLGTEKEINNEKQVQNEDDSV